MTEIKSTNEFLNIKKTKISYFKKSRNRGTQSEPFFQIFSIGKDQISINMDKNQKNDSKEGSLCFGCGIESQKS